MIQQKEAILAQIDVQMEKLEIAKILGRDTEAALYDKAIWELFESLLPITDKMAELGYEFPTERSYEENDIGINDYKDTRNLDMSESDFVTAKIIFTKLWQQLDKTDLISVSKSLDDTGQYFNKPLPILTLICWALVSKFYVHGFNPEIIWQKEVIPYLKRQFAEYEDHSE